MKLHTWAFIRKCANVIISKLRNVLVAIKSTELTDIYRCIYKLLFYGTPYLSFYTRKCANVIIPKLRNILVAIKSTELTGIYRCIYKLLFYGTPYLSFYTRKCANVIISKLRNILVAIKSTELTGIYRLTFVDYWRYINLSYNCDKNSAHRGGSQWKSDFLFACAGQLLRNENYLSRWLRHSNQAMIYREREAFGFPFGRDSSEVSPRAVSPGPGDVINR